MSTPQENYTPDPTTQRRLFWTLLVFGVTLLVLFFVVPNFIDVPLRVSEETTLITEPFFPGSRRLDYVAVLQQRFGPADPHDNGFRMVVQALGGEPMERASGRTWESICRQLDLNPSDPPTMPGFYTVSQTILEQGDSPVDWGKQMVDCAANLWSREQYPYMDEYLDEVSPILNLTAEAVRRESYCLPFVSSEYHGHILLPCHQCNRELARRFLVRANRSIRDDKFDAAWQDVVSAMRLGCWLENDIFVVGAFVGNSICTLAYSTAERLPERSELSEERLRQCIEDIKQLPKKSVSAEDMAMCDQYGALANVDFYSNAPRSERKEMYSDLKCDIPDWCDKYLGVNWNLVARIVNDYHDQQREIYRKNLPPADMQTELYKLENDFKAKCSSGTVLLVVSRDARSRRIALALCDTFHFVPMDKLVKIDQVRRQFLILAFELELEKRKNGQYPATLDFLSDRYTPEELTDPFSDTPFEYQPNADGGGFRLFSKGVGFLGEGIGIEIHSEK